MSGLQCNSFITACIADLLSLQQVIACHFRMYHFTRLEADCCNSTKKLSCNAAVNDLSISKIITVTICVWVAGISHDIIKPKMADPIFQPTRRVTRSQTRQARAQEAAASAETPAGSPVQHPTAADKAGG